jgi:hypothetical protein
MKILLLDPIIDAIEIADLNYYQQKPENFTIAIFCKRDFTLKTTTESLPMMGTKKIAINPWTYWSSEEKIESIRLQRDYLLQQTDWVTIRAVDTETPESQAWKNYRQALRDFPANVNVNLPIEQIVWPQKPA